MHLKRIINLRVFPLLIACLFSIYGMSQEGAEEFPKEHGKFLSEIESMLKATKREDCKLAAETLSDYFAEGKVTPDQLDKLIPIADQMLARKLRPYPYYMNFVASIVSFADAPHAQGAFNDWVDILSKVTTNQRKGNNKNFSAYLDFSIALFSRHAVYASKAKDWRFTGTDFDLVYEEEKPYIKIENTKFLGITSGDTISIKKTSGVFDVFELTWKGDGGISHWGRAGMDSSTVYCSLSNYEIDVSKQSFEADSVDFFFKAFFDGSVKGKYVDQLVANNKAETSIYPRFESYSSDVEITNLAENVSFQGGFNINGSKIYGSGRNGKKAEVIFYLSDGTKALVAKGDQVTIRKPVELNMADTEIMLYFGKDSIYHPSLKLNFKIPTRELRMFRGNDGVAKTKFYNTYHKFEMEADAITWQLGTNKIDIVMIEGAGAKPAIFESHNYFNKGKMRQLQGLVDYDPLSVIKKYYETWGSREMGADAVAKAMNPSLTESMIKGLLYKLVEEGFILYNEQRSLVTIKDKTINYVLANAKKIDYDILRIAAVGSGLSGEINLENYDINLKGVDEVPFSDSSFVYAFPKGRELTLKEDRDMQFNGMILGGNMDFHGEGFYFHYDGFTIDLVKVDSMTINIPDPEKIDEYGNPVLVPLASKFENLNGVLKIDAPGNKSGKLSLQKYPILISEQKSYVYYGKDSADGGAYDRDKFYFEVEPFRLDSLRSFRTEELNFDGKMVTGGIFPEFEEKLEVRPDNSLGFEMETPSDGYPLYGGLGRFTNELSLDNGGFKGKGDVTYANASFSSDSILFYIDSMNAIVKDFELSKVEGQPGIPKVSGTNAKVHWKPYKDSLHVSMTDVPFRMYEDQTTLQGSLLMTKQALQGGGSLDWAEASLESKYFQFRSDDLEADTASLKIKSIDGAKVTFNTPNVHAKIDFTKRIGEFKTNTRDITTTFDHNQYKTAIDEFIWDIDNKILNFNAPPASDGAYFVSTKPGQQELKFLGKHAQYNLLTSILEVDGIPGIKVADAWVIPDSGKVVVEPEAVIRELVNATIQADTLKSHHQIDSAQLKILGKRAVSGSGSYTYKASKLEDQAIQLPKIFITEDKTESRKKSESSFLLEATGSIPVEQEFQIYPNIGFQGDVNIKSIVPGLTFDGFAQITYQDTSRKSAWFKVEDDVDPENFVIPFNEPNSWTGNTVYAGVHFSKGDTLGVYSTLMETKKSRADKTLLSATGKLYYDDQEGLFEFGDSAKLAGLTRRGNILKYNDNSNELYGEGLIDLGMNCGAVDIVSSGSIQTDLDDGDYLLDLTMGVDIQLEKDLMEKLGYYLYDDNMDLIELDYGAEKFQNQITELVSEKAEKKLFQDLSLTGMFNRPKDLENTFVLTDLNLAFDPVSQSYKSVGTFGLSFVGEKPVHLKYKGYVEFGYRRSHDYFNLFFHTGVDDFVFFEYKNNVLFITTSYDEFTDMMLAMKPEDRKYATKDGKFYAYQPGIRSRMSAFLAAMKSFNEDWNLRHPSK